MVTVEDHKTTKKKEQEIKIRQLEFPAEQGHESRHVSVARKKHSIHKQNTHNKNPKNQRLKDWALGPGI